MKNFTFIIITMMIFAFNACQWNKNDVIEKPLDNNNNSVIEKPVAENPAEIETNITALANDVLNLLKKKDFESLALKIHPAQGIRFSPYAYVSNDDLHFSADDFLQIINSDEIYVWGVADGSGFPLEFNFSDYYKAYIWDLDFTRAPEKSFNKRLGFGNSIENTLEFYTDAHFVEYYFDGIDPQYDGMDWRSLRLVFATENGQWYLIGIIHDQWTI